MSQRRTDGSLTVTRRQVLLAGAAFGGAMALPRVARALAYSNTCDWQWALTPSPSGTRFGYLTAFDGIGLANPLASDLRVRFPYTAATAPAYGGLSVSNGTASVVGLLASVQWAGGPSDKIAINMYVSGGNANLLKVRAATGAPGMKSLGFWVANYDAANRTWYEEFYPLSPSPLACAVNRVSPTTMVLNVAAQPTRPNGSSVGFYNVSTEFIPLPTGYAKLFVGNTSKTSTTAPWTGMASGLAGASTK